MPRIPVSTPGGAISENIPREPNFAGNAGAGLQEAAVGEIAGSVQNVAFNLAAMMKKADDLEFQLNSQTEDSIAIKDLADQSKLNLSNLKDLYNQGQTDYVTVRDAVQKSQQEYIDRISKIVSDRESKAANNTQRLMYKNAINEVVASESVQFKTFQRQYLVDIYNQSLSRFTESSANMIMNSQSVSDIDNAVTNKLTDLYKIIEDAEGVFVNDSNRESLKYLHSTKIVEAAVDQLGRIGAWAEAKQRLIGDVPYRSAIVEKDPFLDDKELKEIGANEFEEVKDEYISEEVSIEDPKVKFKRGADGTPSQELSEVYKDYKNRGLKKVKIQVKKNTHVEADPGMSIKPSAWSEFLLSGKKSQLLSQIEAGLKTKIAVDRGDVAENQRDIVNGLSRFGTEVDFGRIEAHKRKINNLAAQKIISDQDAVRMNLDIERAIFMRNITGQLANKPISYLNKVQAKGVQEIHEKNRKAFAEQFPNDPDIASKTFDAASAGQDAEKVKNVIGVMKNQIAADPVGFILAQNQNKPLREKAQQAFAFVENSNIPANPKVTQEFIQASESIQIKNQYNTITPLSTLPVGIAKRIGEKLETAPNGDEQEKLLSRLKESTGKYFPKVFADIKRHSPKVNDSYAFVMSHSDPVARSSMLNNLKNAPEILKASEHKKKDIITAIKNLDKFKKYENAVRNKDRSGQSAKDLNGIVEQLTAEVAKNAGAGSLDAAARNAYEKILGQAGDTVNSGGGNYVFVPKQIGDAEINTTVVQDFFKSYKSKSLEEYGVDPNSQMQAFLSRPIPQGEDQKSVMEQRKKELKPFYEDMKGKTFWVNTPSGDGIQLMYHDPEQYNTFMVPVMSGGKPIVRRFVDIMAGSK